MKEKWKLVSDAPTDGREVLATFKGQFGWVYFIARANPALYGGVNALHHAKPTHWMPLESPKE